MLFEQLQVQHYSCLIGTMRLTRSAHTKKKYLHANLKLHGVSFKNCIVVSACVKNLWVTSISIGNRMDESAIWEKIAWQQENCTRRSRVLFELL